MLNIHKPGILLSLFLTFVLSPQAVEVSEEELDSVISALDLELSIQKANIQLTSGEHRLSATTAATTTQPQ